jgi:hypothetical protein
MQLTELHILESSLQNIDFIHWHVTYMKLQQLKVTQQFGVQQRPPYQSRSQSFRLSPS